MDGGVGDPTPCGFSNGGGAGDGDVDDFTAGEGSAETLGLLGAVNAPTLPCVRNIPKILTNSSTP